MYIYIPTKLNIYTILKHKVTLAKTENIRNHLYVIQNLLQNRILVVTLIKRIFNVKNLQLCLFLVKTLKLII